MIKKYACQTKDFSMTYAGHYVEGGPGTIVNVSVQGPMTSFEIRDDTARKTLQVSKKIKLQNQPEKK